MRRIRMGMVGGGRDAFIGAVHRHAAALDGQIELVCGAFSSTAEKSKLSGQDLGLPSTRCYGDYKEMMRAEALLPADQRMDFVAIVTPNHMHFPVAKLAMESGFHVMSDKPATLNVSEVQALQSSIETTGLLYGLTHVYTGYPMVKEARTRVAAGELGDVRKVVVEYPQGWLAEATDNANKQAAWRLDPAKAGAGGCLGDIGVHAANLAEYVCNSAISQVNAELCSFVDGRALDDDVSVLLRFENGAKGILFATQIGMGEENGINIRVYGSKASLEWRQSDANSLLVKHNDRPMQTVRTGGPGTSELAAANTRLPAGHPEGYIEAFANLYKHFADQIRAFENHETPNAVAADVPGIDAAIRGMRFIERVVESSNSNQKWLAIDPK